MTSPTTNRSSEFQRHSQVGDHGFSDAECSAVEQFIEERPDTSILLALAAGFAVGVGIGVAMGDSSYAGRLRNRRVAEGFGERMMASLEGMLPQSMARNLR